MLRTLAISIVLFAGAAILGHPALAEGGWLDEAKVGVLAHDVGLGDHHVESGTDINAELLFASPDFLKVIFAPRPHIGGTVNTSGNTDYGYFGLTWDAALVRALFDDEDAVFVAGSLGGGIHDGHLHSGPPNRKQLGSRVLFRESVELGYQINPVNNVSFFIDHLSNANLASRNAGLTNVGVRTGFKF